MKYPLSEQKVLEKLNISDFNQITKENIKPFTKMYQQMDPDVATKALEQLPNFVNIINESLKIHKETIDNILVNNRDNMKSFNDLCEQLMTSLQNELNNDYITFEQKQFIMTQMGNLINIVDQKDSENKNFLFKIFTGIGVVVVGVVGFVTVSLFNKTNSDIETNIDSDY